MRTLSRHFSQRVELSTRLIKSTLVLEEEDKDTIKFVAKQKLALTPLLDKFRNPYHADTEKRKLKGLKVLRDIVTILFNDPAKTPGVLGLTNLCWTDL